MPGPEETFLPLQLDNKLLMQGRDLNVLYALYVNLHYMYKLWDCVSFLMFKQPDM